MAEIKFAGIMQSFRTLKISEDGGGLRFFVDLDESEREAWKALSDYAGKSVTFTVCGT